MKCCIIGLGSFGSQVAKSLFEHKAEVLAIDADQTRIATIKDYVTEAICAHLTDETSIREIGINQIDTIIIALGDNFAEAALLTQLLKHTFNIDRVIVQTTSSLQQEVLERVGADQVIFPEKESAIKLADNLTSHLPNTTRITDELAITIVAAPDKYIGKHISIFHDKFNEQLHCIGIIRDGKTIMNPIDEFIEPGDDLIVSGNPEEFTRLTD